ncbi:lipopolysaccharide biosynthesis protein [uncultured Ruminococcus sp.]|uniref:lipopolysaccharide biosynthesis protein n=1 Tax=uncultured Ruminococcus sp. TaxID=165186 RepID=UPI0026047F73|nr:hypothetical protein [uncultured Ruminococcus sp.]
MNNNESRIHNTKRNLLSSSLNLFITTILPFINRTIIIYTLGSEFTGLSGLFGSILQVLSLAEFGFNMVIVYYLYEPIAQNNTDVINQILAWMRKVYHIVGSVIICGGLMATPFLTHLIHGSYPDIINIYILFLIYLLNSGISYFLFAYKEVLLIADQRKDIISNVNTGIKIAINILQFLALLIFKNYYFYVIVLVLGTVTTNLLVNRAVQKRYPYLQNVKHTTKLPSSMKKELTGVMINRLSNVSRNAFDNLIISSTLGLVATAIYGNYFMIYTAVFSITGVFSSSMQASVGNSIAVRSEEDNYENLLDFSFLYSWIFGWCAVALACLYQPFMKLWVGQDLMLNERDMLLFVVYFYFINMTHMRNQYILGNAFWWKLKWAYLIEAIGNLALNIVLGKFFGISGVLIATILTIFFCNYLICNSVLFKNYFKNESIMQFYKQQFYYLLVAGVVTTASYMICRAIDNIFIKALICIIIPNIMFYILYLPCSRWKNSMAIVRRIVKSH